MLDYDESSWQEVLMADSSGLLKKWMNTVAPFEDHKFHRRLRWDGLDPCSALQAIEEADSSQVQEAATWQAWFMEIRNELIREWRRPLEPYGEHQERPFVDMWTPVSRFGRNKLLSHIVSANQEATVTHAALDSLAECLLDRLIFASQQLLWHKFNEERSLGMTLLAHVASSSESLGTPKRDYYLKFIQAHRRDGLYTLCKEYPVFSRVVGTVFKLWLDSGIELLDRIHHDRQQLESLFDVPAEWQLIAVNSDLGDPHSGARTVTLLTFASPKKTDVDKVKRVVYKPRDMGLDKAFQAALTDLNEDSDLPALRTLVVYRSTDYGYMEYVQHNICADKCELNLFYFNAGRLAAILYILGCTDCHHANLIASGSQLILVDAETLLEGRVIDPMSQGPPKFADHDESQLRKKLQQSVLRTGLLPQWAFTPDNTTPADFSALGIASPPASCQNSQGWIGTNSDVMIPGQVTIPVELPTSLPVGCGVPNPFLAHLEDFCDGFRRQSECLIRARPRWLAAQGVLQRFAGATRRVVLRPTRLYYTIRHQQLSPASLASSVAQGLVLEQLARIFLLHEERPFHWPVFAAEVRAMQQLDIPLFTHRIGDDALCLEADQPCLQGLIANSGLSSACKRLEQLDPDEISFQLRLINGVCSAVQLTIHEAPLPETLENDQNDRDFPESPVKYSGIEASRDIAQRLLSTAFFDSSGAIEWLGLTLGRDGRHFSFGPAGADLYSGSIGIACFLSAFAGKGLDDTVSNWSFPLGPDQAIESMLHPLHELASLCSNDARMRWWRDQPLGLTGCGGIMLALHQLGEESIVQSLLSGVQSRIIKNDALLDVVGGCAGLIGSLLLTPSVDALELAIEAGDRILELLSHNGASGGRRNTTSGTGFSHGAAGFAAALARLSATTGLERFLLGAARTLAFERQHCVLSQNNGLYFRSNGEDLSSSWCKGASGIALGRACLWGTELWDEQCEAEITSALRATASCQLSTDHICCGNLGLVAIMRLLLSGPWSIPDDVRFACSIAIQKSIDRVLLGWNDKQQHIHCFGTKEGSLLLPGFFLGLSGIGMVLMNSQSGNTMLSKFLSAGLWPVAPSTFPADPL